MLEMPIPMHYPVGVTLRQLIDDIKNATKEPDDQGIPIDVDPIGIEEADKDMDAMIIIDLEGIPARVTLDRLLNQPGLGYFVEKGLLTIAARDWAAKTNFR